MDPRVREVLTSNSYADIMRNKLPLLYQLLAQRLEHCAPIKSKATARDILTTVGGDMRK